MTSQLLVRLPDALLRRLRRQVPARQRSLFVQQVLERALPPEEEDRLYLAALAAEADARLSSDRADWDVTIGDGIDDVPGAADPH